MKIDDARKMMGWLKLDYEPWGVHEDYKIEKKLKSPWGMRKIMEAFVSRDRYVYPTRHGNEWVCVEVIYAGRAAGSRKRINTNVLGADVSLPVVYFKVALKECNEE